MAEEKLGKRQLWWAMRRQLDNQLDVDVDVNADGEVVLVMNVDNSDDRTEALGAHLD